MTYRFKVEYRINDLIVYKGSLLIQNFNQIPLENLEARVGHNYLFGLLFSLGGSLSLVVSGDSGENSDLSGFTGSDSDDSSVDSAGDAVLELDVDLGDSEVIESGVFLKISLGRAIDHISDGVSFNGFILGGQTTAVGANDGLNVTSTLLGSSVISSLGWHLLLRFNS